MEFEKKSKGFMNSLKRFPLSKTLEDGLAYQWPLFKKARHRIPRSWDAILKAFL